MGCTACVGQPGHHRLNNSLSSIWHQEGSKKRLSCLKNTFEIIVYEVYVILIGTEMNEIQYSQTIVDLLLYNDQEIPFLFYLKFQQWIPLIEGRSCTPPMFSLLLTWTFFSQTIHMIVGNLGLLNMLPALGLDSIKRCHLTSIGNPIVEIRRSYDCLISTMGFPIPVRRHLYIESGPWSHHICNRMNT